MCMCVYVLMSWSDDWSCFGSPGVWVEKEQVCASAKNDSLQALSTPGEQSPHAPSVNSTEAGRSADKSMRGTAHQGLFLSCRWEWLLRNISTSAQVYSPTRTTYHDFCLRPVFAAVGQTSDYMHLGTSWRGLQASSGVSLSLPHHVCLSLKDTVCGCLFPLTPVEVPVPMSECAGTFVVPSLSCVQLFCNPMDYSPPGSSVHGIFQARTLGCHFPFWGDLPDPGIQPLSPA